MHRSVCQSRLTASRRRARRPAHASGLRLNEGIVCTNLACARRFCGFVASFLLVFAALPVLPVDAANAPKPKAKVANVPWDFSGPPQPFAASCFDRFADEAAELTPEEAAGWLAPVDGWPLDITAPEARYGGGIVLKGLARLRAPWLPDSLMRLLLYNKTPVKLHFWMGNDGIRLQYYTGSSSRQMWVAYRITRPSAEQIVLDKRQLQVLDPELAMLVTDSRRNLHAASGVYEIRHQDQTLVLTQGDLRLLTVPVAGPPTDVYFEGDGAIIKRIAMLRGEPVPPEPQRQRRVVMRGERPSELRWIGELPPGARLERRPDGSVRLSARNTAQPAMTAVPLVRPGLYEIIVALEDPEPETGLYLANTTGRVLDAIGFVRDAQTGRTALGYDLPDAPPPSTKLDIEKTPAPYVTGPVWLRLVLAGGRLRFWVSGDGVDWGQVLDPHPAAGAVEQIGLYSKATRAPRSITLRQLRVRELDALSSLAPLGLRERALKIGSSLGGSPLADFGDWDEWVWENQPLDADPAKWRRACGLALLLSNQDVTIMNAVLDGLLRESLSAPGPLDRKLAVLDDAALVRQLHSSTDCQRFAGHFHDLGRQLLRQDDLVGFDSLRHALMRIPRFSYSGRIEALDPMLLRHTLEARATRCRWDAAARLCRQLRFWAEQPIPKRRWSSGHASLQKTAGWAEASASSRLPELKPDDGLVLDPQWRHPVYIDLNKEAENTLLEMRLALRDQEWRFACQGLLGSTAPQWGLVSDQADEQRFRSFSAILSSTMQENPELVRAMGETLGDAELMRLHRAQAAGDVATVEKAAVQYYGTTAAADALAWLGDHRLARGEFTLAIMCYEQAMPVADPPVRAQLAARIRLASAILGHDHGEAVTEPVRFGPEELSPAEFERLAAEMLAAHQSPNSEAADNSNGPAPGLPAPARMTVRSWGQLDGAQGTKPEQVPGGSRSVDWSGRQHAMVVADNSLVVSNRFHVAAFDVPTAKQRWAYDLGDAQGATHAWPMVPMRPLVAGGRVYTRLLRKDGHPDLVCLDLSTGNHVWSTQYPGTVGSDPVVVGDRLVCLCEPHTPGEPVGQLTLTSFSLATGAILDEARLVTLGSQWRSRRVCQLTLVGDRIVAVVAGAVICCDTAGQLRWIRRNTWLPAPLDPYWSRQAIGPPIVVGDRVLATQPGAKTIDCLDLATGRLDWRAARSTLHRMLGTIDQTLVIQTDEGLAAISLDSGEELWHRPIPDLLEGALMGAAGRVICVRHFEGTQVPYATLQWLDGRTGQLLGRQPFWTPSPKYVLVGPLASDGKRAWALAAVADEKGKLTPRRELVELAFEGSLPMVAEPLDGWNPSVPPALRAGAEIVLPGWTLLSAREDKHTGLQAELNGHANALVTRADTTPVRLIRRMRVPDQGKLQMVLDFGHDPHSQSRIEVRVAGLPVWQHFTPAKVAPNPEQPPAATWTQHTVDLSDYTGKDIWITVQQSAVAGGTGYAWWRRLELQQ